MSRFDSAIAALKTEDYRTKQQLLEYLLRIVENSQKSKAQLSPEDKKALLDYACSEVDVLLTAIPQAATYREKDVMFGCEDCILGLIMQLCPSSDALDKEVLEKIQILVMLVAKERYIENYIDNIFRQETISQSEVAKLLSMTAQAEDEYQKGKLYAGLIHYKDSISKISNEGKADLTAYLAAEMKRYLQLESRCEECISNLELMADVCKHFPDSAVTSLLYDLMKLGHSNINYYAVGSLLALNQDIPSDAVASLARDMEYANLTHGLLAQAGKAELFPRECSVPEYLAKSDMVRWLTYPTELGKAPDEIEYLGKITYLFKKEVYYVFKYRSESDTLSDELKGKWLIGWSSEDGGTFSNFDEYALYEKATLKATLKNIKKKLIG